MCCEPGSSFTPPADCPTRRSADAWTHRARSSASGASGSSNGAWPVSPTSPEPAARGDFPPDVVVAVKALACQRPHETGLSLSRPSRADIRREAISRGIVADISGTTTQSHRTFRMERGTVWLVLPGDGYEWLPMGRDQAGFFLDIRSCGRSRVPALGDLICDRLDWSRGEKPDDHSYRFFSRPAVDPNAEDSYRSELFERLDQLTEPHTKLSELCEGFGS